MCIRDREYPTSGQVFYQQEDLFNYSDDQLSVLRRRRFGFVFQAYNLVQELTALENMLLPVMLDKQKPEDDYLKKIIDVYKRQVLLILMTPFCKVL